MPEDNGGKVSYRGKIPTENEKFSACMESDVTAHWLEAIGGQTLVQHIFRVFAKELDTITLADLRPVIVDNMDNLRAEAITQAETNWIFINKAFGF